MIAFGCSRSRVEEVSARLWVCGSFFGPLSFWGVFSPLVVLLLALRGELMECRAFEVARGAKAEESRKTCTSRGKFWHKSRDVPRKLLSFGDRFRIGKLTKKKPLFTGSRDLELLPAQPSLWDTSVFVPELALRGVSFTKRSSAARSVAAKAG